MTDRLPPHSIEAEQAVLGSLLIDRDAIASVADWLAPEAFYEQRNQRVYKAMLWLWNKTPRVPADLVTLTDQLQRVNRLDAVGGTAYLSELMQAAPTAVHLTYYAELVLRCARQRALIDEAAAIVRQAYADDVDLDAVVGGFRRAVEPFAAADAVAPTMFEETMPLHKQWIQDMWDGVIVEKVTPTGIKALDEALLGGLRSEEMMVLAAMSGMGKTAMMTGIAQHAAEATNKLSVIVSLEMTEEAILNRMACATAGVPFSTTKPRETVRIYDLEKRERDERALLAALDYLATLPIAILTKQRTTDRILSELDRLSAQHELGAVLIDHLDHLEDQFRKETDEQRFAELAKRCKGIGQRAGIPTVVLAQVSRAIEAKEPYLPEPKHIRGSGRIRELSQVLVMPYRRQAYVELQLLKADPGLDYLGYPRGNEQRVELFLFKSRNGENGLAMPLGFEPASMSFHDASGERRAA